MLATQPPLSGRQLIQCPKGGRRPLQPKNLSTTITNHVKPAEWAEISRLDDSNKENVPPFYSTPVKKESFQTESINASLTDELKVVREKLERPRIDKDRNDKLLRERALMLDLEMEEILNRGAVQKGLEIETENIADSIIERFVRRKEDEARSFEQCKFPSHFSLRFMS